MPTWKIILEIYWLVAGIGVCLYIAANNSKVPWWFVGPAAMLTGGIFFLIIISMDLSEIIKGKLAVKKGGA